MMLESFNYHMNAQISSVVMCVEEYVSTGESMRRISDDVSLISVLAGELVDLAHLISRLYFPLVDLYIALVD